jgi:phenylacetate-CoA ligase
LPQSFGLTFYSKLPRAGQTLALNLFGIRNRFRLSAWTRFLASVAHTERMPREEQVGYVVDRLRSVLVHAVRTVPRYASLSAFLPDLEDPGSDVCSILAEFPVVTKDEVKADPRAFLSRESGAGRVVRTMTSGTTGTPFTTWMDAGALIAADALWWRRNVWSGYRPGQWIARIVGDPVVPLTDAGSPKPWRVSWVDRRLYLSTFHLGVETIHDYLDVLERVRPHYIMGYPSSLEILSRLTVDAGRELAWRPNAVWFSSEVMLDHQRELIARVFRAPLVGLFGSAERIISAAECERGSYHLALVDGFAEGQFGRLPAREPALLTTLVNRVMPLIRFELGDVISFSPDRRCACGRTLPIVEPAIARHGDWLETPSGRRVAPAGLTIPFKDLPGVRRSQIVQLDDRSIEVHIDADEDAMEHAAELVQERLDSILAGEMDITCVRDTRIEMTDAGKTQFVVRRR